MTMNCREEDDDKKEEDKDKKKKDCPDSRVGFINRDYDSVHIDSLIDPTQD